MKASRLIRLVAIYMTLVFVLFLIVFPWLWLALSSLKRYVEIFRIPPTFVPDRATLDSYRVALGLVAGESLMPAAFRNSFTIAVFTTVIVMALSVLAAYAFGRMRFRFRSSLMLLLLALMVIPPIVLVLPMYVYLARFRLLDTLAGMIVTHVAAGLPFGVWMLSVLLQDVPSEIEDAALVDGCSQIGVLIRVIVPLAAPAIATVASFVFMGAWNEFVYAVILTSTEASITIPVVLNALQTAYEIRWGVMAAGATLHTIPPLVFVLVAQRYIVRGMTLGAIKG